MNIYIAAKWEERAVLCALVPVIEAMGHRVVSRWIAESQEGLDRYQIADNDLRDLDSADLLILDTTYPGGSGREVEFGYALARGKELWIIGDPRNVFHHHTALQHFPNWERAFNALRRAIIGETVA